MFRKIFILAGLLLTLWSTPSAALELAETKAILLRGSNTRVRVSLTLTAISMTDRPIYGLSNGMLTQDEGTLMMTKFLDICLFDAADTNKKCTEGPTPKKLTYVNNSNQDLTTEIQRRTDFTASFVDGSTQFFTQEDDITYQRMTTIIELNATGTQKFTTSSYISLHLMYGSTSGSASAKDVEIKVTPSVAAKGVSSNLEIRPSKGTLTAIWNTDESLPMADGSTAAADGAIAFVIPESGWNVASIPLHSYEATNPDAEISIPGACQIVPDANGVSCTVECDAYDDDGKDYYLKVDDLKTAGLSVTEAGNVGFISINKLANDTRYAFVFQNQPDGLKRSCLISQPSDAVTLSELSGGKEPVVKDPRCFIATAAYGSSLDPHLDTLRWFRDNVLLMTPIGETFVQAYYRNSPPLAEYIGQHPTLRALTRGVLWLPVLFLEIWRERPSLLLTITAMSGTFLLLFLRRRSLRSLV